MAPQDNASETSDSTSISLLDGLRTADALAWERFTSLYAPVIYAWCRRYVQPAEADDVSQEVFVSLANKIGQFERKRRGSFRAWLWTVTRNKLNDHGRRQAKQPRAQGGTDFLKSIEHLPEKPPESSDDSPDSDKAVVGRALKMVRPTVSPDTWDVFRRSIENAETAAEIAADLGMTEEAVRMAKYRVKRKLRVILEGMIEFNSRVWPPD